MLYLVKNKIMKQSPLSCYYTIEGIYKVSSGENKGVFKIDEKLTNAKLYSARQLAFPRFEEIIRTILKNNSLRYDSDTDTYLKLYTWFLKTIVKDNPDYAKQRTPFIGVQQYLSLNLIVDCQIVTTEPQREISSSNKYTIYGIKAGHDTHEYLTNLEKEWGIFNFMKEDISKHETLRKIDFDNNHTHKYKIIQTNLDNLIELGF